MPVEPGVLLFKEGIAAGAGLNLSPTTAHHILPSFIRTLRHRGRVNICLIMSCTRADTSERVFENFLTKKAAYEAAFLNASFDNQWKTSCSGNSPNVDLID